MTKSTKPQSIADQLASKAKPSAKPTPAAKKATPAPKDGVKTHTVTKEKAAPKAAPKTAANPAHAAAIAMVDTLVKSGHRFYQRALEYHASQGTTFPRPRNAAAIAALTIEQVERVKKIHAGSNPLPPADRVGQAIFDIYMSSRQAAK